MKLKILLIGKNGQVGRELLHHLPSLGEVIAMGHHQLDLSDLDGIRRVLLELRPRLIVNAAAYTAVDQAEAEPTATQTVNAEAPAVMSQEAKKIGAALVHFSTDYVFDGSKRTPYEESDPPNPLSVYGRTKLEGERAIQAAGVPHLIFRTSWVYDTQGKNFLRTILRLATQKEELRVVNDQIGAPTWSRMIASGTAQILKKCLSADSEISRLEEYSGVYNMTASGETTWYDFARAILEAFSDPSRLGPWFAAATGGKPITITRLLPILTRDFPTAARRPAYSVLSNAKLGKVFGIRLPHWRSQLQMAVWEPSAEEAKCHQELR